MIAVKFDRSVKYNGIRYAAHEVFNVEDKDIESLKGAGAIVMSPAESNDSPADDTAPVNTNGEQENADSEPESVDEVDVKETLLTYTVAQLKAFAEEKGIDLKGKTSKADIYNAIVQSLN